MATTVRELRRRGFSTGDIAVAKVQQEAERRAGSQPRTIGEIVTGQPARPRPDATPVDLTARQLRRRGRYGQAALLADQEALTERDPERAMEARSASATLKRLAKRPVQGEFDFIGGGNVSTGFDFHDAVVERLQATDATPSERATAHMVLSEVIRRLKWQSYECDWTAAQIGERLGLVEPVVSRTLARLESVGALARVKQGRRKVIVITPEGAYRGKVENHAETVEKYRAAVVQLRQPPRQSPPSS